MCDGVQRHTVVSLALRLAAFISGIGFAGYHKLLKRHLGMHAVTDKNFYEVIEMAYPHVKDILDEITAGRWDRAITTSDGCWHIHGFFSQNSTFVICNFLTL